MAAAKNEFSVFFQVKENGRKVPKYTIDSDLDGTITLQDLRRYAKELLTSTAYTVLKEELDRGFPTNFITTVDGRANKSVMDVDPFGRIVFTAPQAIGNIARDIWLGLTSRSKIVTGRYVGSHKVYYNNNLVASDYGELTRWLDRSGVDLKEGDVLTFLDSAPYARMLERKGVTKSTPSGESNLRFQKSRDRRKPEKTIQAPNGVYWLTTKAMKRKYKNNVDIRFKFVTGSEFYIDGNFKGKTKPGKSPRAYLYPAIQIRFTKGGAF